MAVSPMSWRQSLIRQYKNDPDLHVAVNSAALSCTTGLLSSIVWELLSRSFFAIFGIVLLSSVYVARKRSWNPSIALQASLIGFIFGAAIAHIVLQMGEKAQLFPFYVAVMSIFHFTEFFFTAITNRRGLQADSFLLNHSVAYSVAAAISWIEFFFELYFVPSVKITSISLFGIGMCMVGEVIRKLAMVDAGTGFTHRLAYTKRPDHRLCTSGIYAYARHPGYLGWLLWSVGTQIVLCNPFCFLLYAYVSWRFFDDRIMDEEKDLINFFGAQYIEYQHSVWIGVPFVEGYKITN